MSIPNDCHARFIQWSRKEGVFINDKIKPEKFPGRGVGIASSQKIHAGEKLVFVPRSALFTVEDVPPTFRTKVGTITVHGLLSAFLAFRPLRDRGLYSEWKATWPTYEDLGQCMPMLWPRALRSGQVLTGKLQSHVFRALPQAIDRVSSCNEASASPSFSSQSCGLLSKQEKNFRRDWEAVSRAFSTARCKDYLYYWLIVNTRSFYYELPEKGKTQPRADRMVLCPFVDYFNHADHGCHVEFDPSGFTVTSDKDYDPGEELYTSYGAHNNDFLLVEYGFFLQQNAHDSIPLDDFVLDILDDASESQLEVSGYFRSYTLYPSPRGPCHRTAVAIGTQTLTLDDWNLLVLGKTPSIGEYQAEELTNRLLMDKVLRPYLTQVERTLQGFEDQILREEVGAEEATWETLKGRWLQIRDLLESSLTVLNEGDRKSIS